MGLLVSDLVHIHVLHMTDLFVGWLTTGRMADSRLVGVSGLGGGGCGADGGGCGDGGGRFMVVGGGDGCSGGVSFFFPSETDFPKCSFRDGRKL